MELFIDYPVKSDYFRCDTWIQDNTTIGLKYDSLLSKIMVYGQTVSALDRMSQVLKEYKIYGSLTTNLSILNKIINHQKFILRHQY